jgi:hypothetical protein
MNKYVLIMNHEWKEAKFKGRVLPCVIWQLEFEFEFLQIDEF